MSENLTAAKATLAAAFTAVGTVLGWKGVMLMIWVGVMALDYLSGTLAACREGKWSSKIARQGLWHKGGMILVVTVAAIADGVMGMMTACMILELDWPGLVLPLVLAWYIITELGSILENAVKMGASVPEFLVKLLKSGIQLTDSAGDSAAESIK